MSELPSGWAETTLGEIQLDLGEGINPARFPEEKFELYSVPSHTSGLPEIVKGAEIGSNKQTVSSDTVLLCKINPRINRVWVVDPKTDLRTIGSTEWIPFSPRTGIRSRYLAYFLQQSIVRDYLAHNASGVGGSLMRVKPSTLSGFPFVVAPEREQDRIVAEIEKQFTRLDAATAALKRVQANLKRYRASVLKAACEGRMVPTEAELARKEGRDYEPADKLLERILRERRARWEADTLAKMIASGKPPKDDSWKRKYKEPSAPDIANLPAVPEGWCWTTVDSLIFGITAGRSFKCEERPPENDEYGVVKVSAVTWGRFDELESKTCLPGSEWVEEFRIRPRDFLFSRANTIELVGACVIVGDVGRRLMLSDKILRFDSASETLKRWLLILLRSRWGRSEIERLATGNQESMRNIGQERIRAIRIPLAPEREIERAVESANAADDLESRVMRSAQLQTQKAKNLRQGILQQAFSGGLACQDPNDEPASLLLERIRAERAAAANGKPNKRTKKEQAYA